MQNLKENYQKNIAPKLKEELKVANIQAVPRLVKITINSSSKDFKNDKDFLAKTKTWLTAITGQVPSETRAKTSIAAFNLRQGEVVGLKITLRGNRMYDFLEKLISIVLPRLKDFQGINRHNFDKQGNYTLGLAEQIVFPEVEYDKIGRIQGLEITISTSAKDPQSSLALLLSLGMPFTKEN